jgi:hypothetical protein
MEMTVGMNLLLKSTTLRNRANYLISWVVVMGLWALLVGVDLLHLYSQYDAPDESASFIESLPIYAWLFSVMLLVHCLGIRPYIQLRDDAIVIHNPIRVVTIPLATCPEIDASGKYLKVICSRQRYTAWGMERYNLPVLASLDNWSKVGDHGERSNGPASASSSGKPVASIHWRRLEGADLVTLALWLGYAIAAAFSTFFHLSPAPFA